jgi:uncharacterized protein (DUF362 family)
MKTRVATCEVKALVELLLPIAGKVIIAEGSSINRSETGRMFALYGYDRLIDLDPQKVSLVDLNKDELVEKEVPGGKRMLSRKIPITLEKADIIITVSKFSKSEIIKHLNYPSQKILQ